MSLTKTLRFTVVVLVVSLMANLPFSQETQAETGKTVELNTRGACLKIDDFKALMNSEVKKMKSGDTIKLIIDTPNEPQANDAIKQEGHTVTETSKNKDKDSTTYQIKVNI